MMRADHQFWHRSFIWLILVQVFRWETRLGIQPPLFLLEFWMEVVEEDGRFRPKSVDLLGDCGIIDSRAPITLDAREDNNKGGFPLVLTI